MRSDLPRFLTREGRHLPGEARTLKVAQPNAGAEWSASVPGGRQWRVRCGFAQLVTAAGGSGRMAGARITDGDVTIFDYLPQLTGMGASQTGTVGYLPGGVEFGSQANNSQLAALPDMWLPPSAVISSRTNNLAAGDQYSLVALYIEEAWFDNQQISSERIERLEEVRAALLAAEGVPEPAAH